MNGERQKRKDKGSEILFLSSFKEIKVHRREVPMEKGTSLPMEKALIGSTQAQLQLGFYAKSCPKAEKIILKYVVEHSRNAPSLAVALIRMHFRDCFVNVCAQTIGVSHCPSIVTRLYNFTGKGDTDPTLDNEYAKNLKTFKCKNINDNTTLIEMDPGSCDTFDLGYYKQVVKRMGLFQSDVSLLESSNTRAIIIRQLQSTQGFFAEFAKSMEKMGRINVKIETKGEIRKHCTQINS
ncbi:Peroxidase 3 [Glycine soja]|nr:Peroxidase 3 [Glycine soja]